MGWNYNALHFALCHAMPQCIKDVLHLASKQTTYDGYKALITQIDQCYWEDQSKNTALWTTWNTSNNTNWQAGATNGNQPSILTNFTNPMPHLPQGQEPPSANQPLGPCPSAQLNTADLHKTPEPLDTNSNNLNNAPDSANNQEALCANKIQNRPWIDVPEKT
ncbi:hypothetical protein J132_01262 [Termitomyces sp. J132]|nr:hypothetical protein J132_01262 [Termitomyces sp. J132]